VPSESALRRAPVQDRSSRRVDRILEECALALDEFGYEGISTSMLAERAGMSVGGLYRFFESKQAVVAELRRRRLADFLAGAEQIIEEWQGDWYDLAAALIDGVALLRRTVPGSGVLQLSSMSAEIPRDPEEDERSASSLAVALAKRLGRQVDHEFATVVLVAYVTGDALCSQAFRSEPSGDEVILSHAKAIVGMYLAGGIVDWDPPAMA